MEKLAVKLSERLYQEKIIADDEREVYQYCIEVTISTVSYWASILICAVLLGKLWESVVYLGAFMVMRFCFGGYHASTHFRCALVSMASYGIFLTFIFLFPIDGYGLFAVMSWLITAVAGVVFAPVEHENRPFTAKEQKKFRKGSLLSILLVSIILSIGLALGKYRFLVCLCFGVLQASISLVAAVGQNKFKAQNKLKTDHSVIIEKDF